MKKAMKYVIVRTHSAGVFAGLLESRKGQEVVMRQARRLWYWQGAASLSQLAMEGVTAPDECKFPVAMAADFKAFASQMPAPTAASVPSGSRKYAPESAIRTSAAPSRLAI